MKFNVLAGYLLALTIVGFFLWIIRGFVRGLRQEERLPGELPAPLHGPLAGERAEGAGKIPVDWPCHLFLPNDDLEYPGRVETLTAGGAFVRCPAPLRVGQRLSLYLAVPADETRRLSAKVLWVGPGKGRQPVAQMRFEGMGEKERERLLKLARDM